MSPIDERADGVSTSRDAGLYETIRRRRDVRREFTGERVDPGVLGRILEAAHAAPSVGLSQPWDFILVEAQATKEAFWHHVEEERVVFAGTLQADQLDRFVHLKIDGVREASLGLVVTYDPERGAPGVLGRHAIAETGLYSVCLAIENLWLAATVEGWGVGWVSFYREAFVRRLLGIPETIKLVGWLCLGPVSHLETAPDLERAGWQIRRPLSEVLHRERW